MKYLGLASLLLAPLLVLACGGSVEPARAVTTSTSASPPAAASAPASVAAPVVVPPIASPEEAAKAFVDAIARHDTAGAIRASDEDLGRGQSRAHAAVTAAKLDGPADSNEWPGIEALHATLFWATFTSGTEAERMLLAVDRESNKVIGIRDQELRDRSAADRRALAAKPVEVKGKLLSKPLAGSVRVEVDASAPAVGDKVELSRQVDPSLPFIGGSWVVIADTEVTAVVGKTITLKILAQKSEMKINGKALDHYTPGVPISLQWTRVPPKP